MQVKVGTVNGCHGIKGEIKIFATTDFPDERFAPGNEITLKMGAKEFTFEIETHRYHKKMELVKFVGLDNINDVEKYKGAEVWAEQVDELEEGEFYFTDLIGCEVINEENKVLGKVINILEMPTQDLLEIEDEKGTFLVPYVDAFIIDEDIENKVITVSLIEGLGHED